jgi:hypothetical protein
MVTSVRIVSAFLGVALTVSPLTSPQMADLGTSTIRPAVPVAKIAVGYLASLAAPVGSLSITVPAGRNYGAGFVGGVVGGELGTVMVSDSRPVNPNTWVVRVSSTSFTTGAGLPAQTITNNRVSYWSGTATSSSGGGNLVPGQPTSAQAQTLDIPRTAFSKTSGNQDNTVAWSPRLSIMIPTGATSGTYTGRITHSVA